MMQMYVDEAAFVNEWGIGHSISEYNKDLCVNVIYTQFINPNRYDNPHSAMNNRYINRLTVNGNEITAHYDNGPGLAPFKARPALRVRAVEYMEADFYNGGFQEDLANAMGGSFKYGALASLVPTIDAGLRAGYDICIDIGGDSTFYFIDGSSKTLKYYSPFGGYLYPIYMEIW